MEWSRYTEGALIHRQIKQMGWDLPRFGSDGIAAPAFLDLAKDAANGVIYPTHFSPATSSNLPAAQDFIALVRKTYNKPPDYVHAQAFDAANIAIAAIERAKSGDRTAVRNALRQTDHRERARTVQVRPERRSDARHPHGADRRRQRDRRTQLTGGNVTIRVVKSGIPRPLANYNEAFVVGDLVFAAGQLASDFKTGVPPEARKKDGFPFYGSDIELQTAYILENLKKTFEAAGSSLDHVVKAQVFLTDLNNFHGFDTVWKRYFKVPPPRTTIGCTGLLVNDTLVEIDLIAYVPSKGLEHEVITSSIPRPLANYNEAVVVGDLVFAAGQLASDFKTGVPPEARKKDGFPFYGSDIELQTAYILDNLKKTFEAAGSSLDHVVKAQVFLTDLDDFHGFDSVWKRYFKVPPPRTTIGCTGLLVKDTLVEIDLIGYVARKGLEHQVVKSAAPRPLAHYSEGFTLGSHVFAAGQIASDYRTGVPPEARKKDGFPFYGSDIELQTAYILENLKKTFEAAGSSLDQVVKAQVFLTDLDNFHGFDTVWKRYFKQPPPRTTIGCTGLLVKDTLVEIDLIGENPK